jgi:glycosyltransferase involved in cell wall biosynthesis
MHIISPYPARLIFDKPGKQIPLITIAIPTYRRDTMLVEALMSALVQDATVPIEILVVDNDPESAANVLSLVDTENSRHSVRYFVNETNLGMFGNWNQCIALARGRWFTLLHDDDWLAPSFISEMMPLARDGVDFAVCRVASGVSAFDPAVLRRRRDSDKITYLTLDDLIFGNPSPAPGILILKEALVAAGGFDPSAYPCADYITYARCALNVRAALLNRTLAYYRISDSQTFKDDTLEKIIKQSIEIKQNLMRKAPPTSLLTYILSMAYWFRLAREHGKSVDNLADDRWLKIALVLSRLQPLAFALLAIRKFSKGLSS